MARGTANVNNLLKTAMTARDKQLAYNDQAAAFQWNMSAKTADDLAQYRAYLKKAQGETTDPSKQLSTQTKLVDANRTYTSSEIGRQTIAVLRGEGDNRQKLGVIARLQDQASANGDASLVQQLDDTYSRLTKTIQDEQAAAASKASNAAKAATTKGLTDQLNTWKQGQALLKNAFENNQPVTGPDGQPVKVQYQNGKPVLDKNGMPVQSPGGKPLVLDARTYAAMHGVLLKQQEAVMNQQIAQGDETGSKQLALDNLHASPEWNQFASDTAFARNQSNSNPFTTVIDPATGKRSIKMAEVGAQTTIDPATGKLVTQMAPKEGDVGNQFVQTTRLGSSPDAPLDRTSSTKQTVQLGKDAINLPDAAGTVPGQGKIGGYGQQTLIANPNTSLLPNSKPRADSIYIAPDGSGVHSVAPLKVIGKDDKGKPLYGTSTAADFGATGGGATQFVNDWKTGAGIIGKGLAGTASAIGNAGSRIGVPNFLGNAVNGVMDLFNHGQQVQQQQQAAAKQAADLAAQRAAISAANQAAAAKSAQAAAANAAHPSIMYAAPAASQAVPVAKLGTPAAPIGSVPFTQTLLPSAFNSSGQPWWMK